MYTIGLDVHQRLFVLCILDAGGKLVKEERLRGDPQVLWTYLQKLRIPFQICYEASCSYGYLYDHLQTLARRVVVAHPGGVRLIFRAKRKHDRIDARKLATLLFLDQVPSVHVPAQAVRTWRRLIQFRRRLVARRTAVKNHLRALLRTYGITPAHRQALWSRAGRAWLATVTLPDRAAALERDLGLDEMAHLEARIHLIERELTARARLHPGVALLQTIPGVGPRTAEALVAWLDDVRRFRHNRQAGCYFGLVPCQDQSAGTNRLGHITREGPSVVRHLLTEAAWRALSHSAYLRARFEQVQRDDPERKKIALVATARYLACVATAMLRSGAAWWHDTDCATTAVPAA